MIQGTELVLQRAGIKARFQKTMQKGFDLVRKGGFGRVRKEDHIPEKVIPSIAPPPPPPLRTLLRHPLCLPRPRDRPICRPPRGLGVPVHGRVAVCGHAVRVAHGILGRINGRDFHLAHVDRGSGGSAAALTASLAGLFVGGEVKGDEKEEVGGEDADAGEGGEFFTGTFPVTGEVGEVGGGKVGVGGEVDES